MIEADKMLHLRKYAWIVLRSNTKSRVVRSLHSTSLSAHERGYVPRSLHHCYVPQMTSQSNYIACGIRTLCTAITQSSADEIDQKLASFCDDVKHGQTWSADRLKEVIQLCDKNDYQLQPSTGVLLLKCCGSLLSTITSNERQNLASQVWQLAKRNGDALTLEHYNTLLNVHAENCSSVDPKEFLADMSVQPDDDTYRLLFDTAVKTSNTKHLQSIMLMILEKKISLDEDAFRTLMRIHLTKGNVAEALNVITLMQDAKMPVDKLYTELAYQYAAQGNMPNLVSILNDHPQSDVSLLKIIKSLSISGNGKHIGDVIRDFLTGSVSVETKSEIDNLITELVRADRATDAHAIINCLASKKEYARHTTNFVDNFLNQLIMMNVPVEDITRFVSDFVESGLEPMALNNVAEIALKLGREKLSLSIFAAMRKNGIEVRAHYYWPLLINAQQNEGETKIFSLIESMQEMNVEIDHNTLITYILPYVNTANPITTLQRLKICGIPNIILHTPMIYFLLKQNRLEEVLYLYQHVKQILNYKVLLNPLVNVYLVTRNVENCARVLTTFKPGLNYVSIFLTKLIRNNLKLSTEELQALLKTFNKYKVKFPLHDAIILKNRIDDMDITTETYTKLCGIIDSMIDKEQQVSMLTVIPHPRYMTTTELACHFVELKSKELGTRGTLQRLLEAYCQENNLQKAEEVKQEFDRNLYTWTPGMKVHLFDLYTKHNKLKDAEALLLEIQKTSETFLVDSNKILNFAIALIKAGNWKMAFDVIENFPNVNNTRYMNRNCSNLLTVLANSEHHENTKNMLHLLIQKKFCNITTELLRPLVAIPLRQNDVLSAVETLKKCVQLHKKLPMAQGVFTALLREKDKGDNQCIQNVDKYIEEVYNMIMTLKGIEVANTVVVIALASLNKMEELQIILEKQKIVMNSLVNYFSYTQRFGDISVYLRILEASQDSKNVNQSFLCDMILNFYSKNSDYKSALALWELMCAKDIKPSTAFKQGFIEFFQSNKVPLPAEFESDISEVNVSNQ